MAHKNKGAPGKVLPRSRIKEALGYGRGWARGPSDGRSLKDAVRALLASEPTNDHEKELKEMARRWFHNKRVNTRAAQKGIGRTNRIVVKKK